MRIVHVSQPVTAGVGGRVTRERRLVVLDAVSGFDPGAIEDMPAVGLAAVMAAPVQDHGKVIGTLAVGSRADGREYGSRELLVSSWLRLLSLPSPPLWNSTCWKLCPCLWAHTGNTVTRRPYGQFGPELKSNRPGRLAMP